MLDTTRWTIWFPTAKRRNSPWELMLTATNQGDVRATKPARPHLQWKRCRGGTGQPHHQAKRAEARIRAGPIGPLVKVARLRRIQNPAAARPDGRRLSTQRQA